MSGGPATIEGRGKVLAAEEFARALPAGARLLGLDVGTKTVGLALSDVTRTIASGGPARGVLEVVAGTARKLGLAPGDRVAHPWFQGR